MSLMRKAFPIVRLIARQYSKEADKIVVNPGFAKLKETQKKFACDDGLPIWLKGGSKDKILYQASWGLVLLGLGLSIELFVRMVMRDLGFGRKDEEVVAADTDKDKECPYF